MGMYFVQFSSCRRLNGVLEVSKYSFIRVTSFFFCTCEYFEEKIYASKDIRNIVSIYIVRLSFVL